jgi:hypothetical protein
LTAFFISFKFDAPVDKKIGFFVFAIVSNNKKLVISQLAILYVWTPIFSRTLTESISKGVY